MENLTKWTPGPWRVGDRGENEQEAVVEPNGGMVADCAIFGLGAPPSAVCEANARLIAAAPELYRSLDDLMLWVIANFPAEVDGPIATKARAALAKARGEAP